MVSFPVYDWTPISQLFRVMKISLHTSADGSHNQLSLLFNHCSNLIKIFALSDSFEYT